MVTKQKFNCKDGKKLYYFSTGRCWIIWTPSGKPSTWLSVSWRCVSICTQAGSFSSGFDTIWFGGDAICFSLVATYPASAAFYSGFGAICQGFDAISMQYRTICPGPELFTSIAGFARPQKKVASNFVHGNLLAFKGKSLWYNYRNGLAAKAGKAHT